MSNEANVPSTTSILPLQVITALLVIGPVMFLGLLMTFGFLPRRDEPLLGDFMTHTAIGVAVLAIAANLLLWATCKKFASRSNPRNGMFLLTIRTTMGIVIFAFAAFFSAIAFMLDESIAAFIVTVVMIIGIASCFPTKAFVQRRTSNTRTDE